MLEPVWRRSPRQGTSVVDDYCQRGSLSPEQAATNRVGIRVRVLSHPDDHAAIFLCGFNIGQRQETGDINSLGADNVTREERLLAGVVQIT